MSDAPFNEIDGSLSLFCLSEAATQPHRLDDGFRRENTATVNIYIYIYSFIPLQVHPTPDMSPLLNAGALRLTKTTGNSERAKKNAQGGRGVKTNRNLF